MFDQFKHLKALGNLVGRMDEIKERFAEMQAQLKVKTVTGEGGGGVVRCDVNGAMEVVGVHLDPAMVASIGQSDDATRELVQDLIVEATNDGLKKSQEMMKEAMASLAKEFDLPDPKDFGAEGMGGLGGLLNG